MPLNLANYEKQTKETIKAFWGNRAAAREKQIALDKIDQGERAGVTSDGQPVTDAAGRASKRPHTIRLGEAGVRHGGLVGCVHQG